MGPHNQPHVRDRVQGRVLPSALHRQQRRCDVHTRSLAREFGADNVLVNAVSPGYTLSEGNLANTAFLGVYRKSAIETRSIPRDAWPADISGAVAFLASEDAGFITGQILAVDGGSVYH
jgi:NAD(P)-dependent dehydrogenase (short-subunit alcohol dehydrogenase family)